MVGDEQTEDTVLEVDPCLPRLCGGDVGRRCGGYQIIRC